MTNQTFPIIFRNERFMVDPSCLYDSSKKFQELIKYNNEDIQTLHLRIAYDNFTTRNMSNFLKICQNQQTDVQNSELEEICLIAKMFQADQIYDTGVTFIQENVDPNFFIPYNKFSDSDGIRYLILETDDQNPLIHHINLNELDFDESSEFTKRESKDNNNKKNNTQSEPKKKACSVCYQITEENPLSKHNRYNLSKDDKILFQAKMKKDEIFITAGKNKNAAIIKRNNQGYNIVAINDQEFKIKYVKFGDQYSLEVSFVNNGSRLEWMPRNPKKSTEIVGQHNHVPIRSKKNIILQSPKTNNPTCIVRKMSKKVVEVECHPLINPIIAFSIAISQKIGPAHNISN